MKRRNTQHTRSPDAVPLSFVVKVLEIVSFAGVLGLHHLICVRSPMVLLYLPLVLVASRWFFPVLSVYGLAVAAAAPWIASEMGHFFLTGQTVTVILLLVFGRLVAAPAPSSVRGRLLVHTGRAIRATYITVGAVLLVRLAVFRDAPLVESIAWSVTLWAFVWKAPWPPARTKTSWKQKAINGALLVGSVCLCFAGAEVAARLLFPSPIIKQSARAGFEAHPTAFWTLRPDRTDTYTTMPKSGEPREFVVSVSAQGVRGPEVGPKEPDEFRVVALGDSLTMGWGVAYEDSYPHILEELLSEQMPGRKVTVINAGVAGYGPWQERIFLLERCFALEPDLVILQLYPENDVHNTLNQSGEYLESYNEGWERMVLYWRYHADWRMQAEWWMITKCRLYAQFQSVTGTRWDLTTLLRQVRFLPPLRIPELPPQEPRPFYLEFMLQDWYPQLEEAWERMQEDVLRIRDDCDNRGIEFFAFCLPSWIELSDEDWEAAIAEAGDPVSYVRFKDVALCEEFFESAGIPYVPIVQTLVENGPVKRLYMNDGHLTPTGNRILAERLASSLDEHLSADQ
ncbi:MAG: hypothetical protein AMXMBFR82_27530 [Candidatus Hydrogenedentota bacterium]